MSSTIMRQRADFSLQHVWKQVKEKTKDKSAPRSTGCVGHESREIVSVRQKTYIDFMNMKFTMKTLHICR